ncbi:hypothetical protein BOTBODRAFT_102912 [Botryobasidium botryosum FD-172 SS1]|uniref:J domain-containing protein n=1 Tax=Botryobasidium botryosum (strain FD-172 SS1) TaxID=930990 RepID=A0A067N490_BOTB1|nr:hypothetical protein BOTBODRAFT_102912 [Botryobasidium botryosum FD-172 SS1]
MSTDLYEALGITKSATTDEIRKAYKRQALRTHPDRVQDKSLKKKAEEDFRRVNAAYEVLIDEENRKLYDKHGVWPPPANDPSPGHGSGAPHRGAGHRSEFSGGFHHPRRMDPFDEASFGPFGGGRHRPVFVFSDPFALFESIFKDRSFREDDDDFFQPPFMQPRSGRRPPNHFDPFAPVPIPLPSFAFPFGRPPIPHTFSQDSDFDDRNEATAPSHPHQKWVSESTSTVVINGVVETVKKRVDAKGNQHVWHRDPCGRETYTVNGIDQRPARIRNSHDHLEVPPPPPPHRMAPAMDTRPPYSRKSRPRSPSLPHEGDPRSHGRYPHPYAIPSPPLVPSHRHWDAPQQSQPWAEPPRPHNYGYRTPQYPPPPPYPHPDPDPSPISEAPPLGTSTRMQHVPPRDCSRNAGCSP